MLNKTNNIIILLVLVTTITTGIFLGQWLFSDANKKAVVYSKFEQIRYLKELHLITHHFEEIIPIEREGTERLKLLLIVPAKISGYMNLANLKFNMKNDTLGEVTLPKVLLTDPIIEIDKAMNYNLEKKFGLRLGTGLYNEVFSQLKLALVDTKKEIITKAVANGIKQQTQNMGRMYIQNMITTLGYQAQFTDRIITNDSL